MAVKKIITIEVDDDDAIKSVDNLTDAVKDFNKEVVKSNENTEKSLKGVEDASKSTAKGIRAIGTTIKAIGIGLLLQALGILQDLFNSNQKIVDLFNVTFEALSIAFNDFVNFIDRNFGKITGFFDSIFKDPLKTVKDLGNAIKNNIIERFNSALEVAGFLAKGLKQLFAGDFAGALESAKEAGKELVDVMTGVDDTIDKGIVVVKELSSAVADYSVNVVKSAIATNRLRKESELLEVVNQGLIERYDVQAEKLRQVRDDDRLTIQERIKANNDLKKVLEEQQRVLISNADKRVQAAQLEFEKDKTNQEARLALQTALNERKAIEAQVTGFLSEQKVNEASLERELLDLKQSDIDATNERLISAKRFTAEQIQGDVARLEALKQVLIDEESLETQRLITKRDNFKKGTQAYVDANNELLKFQQENNQQQIALENQLQNAKQQALTQGLAGVAGLVGESSAFGKGIAISQAIIDTYAGANKALAQGGIFGKIAAAGIIASGLANVNKIVSTQAPELPSFASGVGGSSGGANVSLPPAFNIVGASVESQLAQTIAEQTNEPVQAYVVSNDVTTAQSLDRNIVNGASL